MVGVAASLDGAEDFNVLKIAAPARTMLVAASLDGAEDFNAACIESR